MASIADLARDARRSQTLVQALVGMRGSLDFVDDEWAGAGNYDPASVNKGSITFNQTNLDTLFGGSLIFTVAEWTAIQGALAAVRSAIGANAQTMDRLSVAPIIG